MRKNEIEGGKKVGSGKSKFESVPLGEVAQINPPFSANGISADAPVSFVPMAAVSEITGQITQTETRKLDDCRRGYTSFKNGDVLLAKITPCFENGKIALARIPHEYGFGSTEFHVVRTDERRLFPRYLFYFLRQPCFRIAGEHRMTGSAGQRRVPSNFLSTFEIPLPLLPLQKRIAAILDKADAIRRKRQQAIKLADDFLRATFLDMFGDPVTNPKGWEVRRLDEISDIQSGITKGRKLNGNKIVNVPYMRVANVQDGHINLNEIKEIEATPTEIERYSLHQGDILLTEGGDPDKLGRGAVWQSEINPCIHQNHIFRVRPNRAHTLPDYLSALIGSSRGKQYFLIAAKQTTGIASVNKTQLSSFPALLPPLHLQQEFVELVKKHSVLRQKLELLNDQQNDCVYSLAQGAFRGEL